MSVLDVVLILALSSFRIGPAWFSKLIIDQAVPQRSMNLLVLYLVGLVVASLATNVFVAIETYIEQYVGQKVIYDLRNVLYGHLQSQSMSFYDKNQTGQLMSRVTNDVSQVQFFLTQGIARLVNTVATVGIYMVVLFLLDPQLTLVTLIVAPAIWMLQRRLKEAMPLMRQTQRWMADLNVVIQEYVAGVKMIRAFNREPHEAARFDKVNRDIRQNRMKQQQIMAT